MLYIGFTSDLVRRIKLHRSNRGAKFTKEYNVYDLMYFEIFDKIYEAKEREKQLKRWHKEWKWNLIKEHNPELKDLFDEIEE